MSAGKGPAVVLASGPSLTADDIERVRQSGLFVVAVNTTWEEAPFCDLLYAGDANWWKHNGDAVKAAELNAERWSCTRITSVKHGTQFRQAKLGHGYNSGANACELLAHLGYSPVIMLGFDCSVKNGTHHHGNHKKTANPTEVRCQQWKKHFKNLLQLHPQTDFINCSRETAIDCIERAPLSDAIEQVLKHENN